LSVRVLDSRPTALVVTPTVPFPPVGGGEKRTLRLLEAMERAGARPHVVTEHEGGDADGLRALGYAIDVVSSPAPTVRRRATQHLLRRPSPYLMGVAERLSALARDAAFVQVEHAQSAYYGARFGRRPVVLSMHNVDSALLATVARSTRPMSLDWARSWNRWHATRTVERRAAPRASAVLCVSEADRAHFARQAREVLLAPNGVDNDLFLVPDLTAAGRPTEDVLFFGRLDYGPNLHGLLRFLAEGWPALAARRPRAHLRIAGHGAGTELREAVAGLDRVDLLGPVPSMPDELERSTVTLVPLWQGGGTRLKALESLAAGRPAVGTALGLEQIGFADEHHGLLAETPRGLADATVALLEDPARAGTMGRHGRELAGSFRWVETLRPAEDLYRRLLDRRGE